MENKSRKFVEQFAQHVTAVVGLNEAVTWKHKWLKLIWIISLVVGVASTVWFVYNNTKEYLEKPTATKVKLESQPSYDYPSIIACPPGWLNITKALSLGFTMEGLKYSLGYVFGQNADKKSPSNVNSAKSEFMKGYVKQNFKSLHEYLLEISLDMPVVNVLQNFAESSNFTVTSGAFCQACENGQYLTKGIREGGVCYIFNLIPEKNAHEWTSRPIAMKSPKASPQIITSHVTDLYFGSISEPSSMLRLKPLTSNTIRIRTQQFISVNTKSNPCAEDMGKNSSSKECHRDCMRPMYDRLNCTPIGMASKTRDYQPQEICNLFDTGEASLFTYVNFWGTLEHDYTKLEDECTEKCPPKCDSITYETTRVDELAITEMYPQLTSGFEMADRVNITAWLAFIENRASYEGGIMTWLELETDSTAELVGNIGGILGMFIGATMMTFIQIILFCAKFMVEKKEISEETVHVQAWSDKK